MCGLWAKHCHHSLYILTMLALPSTNSTSEWLVSGSSRATVGGGSFITPLNLMVQFAWIMFCVLALRKKKEQTLQKYLIYFDKVQKRSANLHICKPERFKYYSIISIFSVSQLYSVFISINNTSGNYAILYILYLKRGKCFFVSFTSRIN